MYSSDDNGCYSIHCHHYCNFDFNELGRLPMDATEICSLLMLILAYVIIVMLIVIYEVMECRFSRLQHMFHIGNHSTPQP